METWRDCDPMLRPKLQEAGLELARLRRAGCERQESRNASSGYANVIGLTRGKALLTVRLQLTAGSMNLGTNSLWGMTAAGSL